MIFSFIALSALLCAAPARAAAVTRHQLDNGLVVVLQEDHAVPLVAVNTWYKVGSRDEVAGRTGFAHLFEHFMFEGSEHAPQGQYDAHINGRGGVNNATTSFDRTNYWAVVPSENLEEVLRLESDRMGFLRGSINPDALLKQQKIVSNELRQGANQPYGAAFEELCALTWPAGHGYSWTPGGRVDHVQAATVDEARAFHERYYTPDNAVLVISGDHDSAATLELVKKWYGAIPRGAGVPRRPQSSPERLGARREKTIVDPKAQLPLMLMAFPVPPPGSADSRELAAAASVLTTRLGKNLQRRRRMTLSASASLLGTHARDLLLIEAMPAPGVDLADLEAAIMAEIAALASSGIEPGELARVKAGLATARIDALQELQGLAETLAENEAERGDALAFDADIKALEAMDAAAPSAAAARWLAADNLAVLRILPAAGASR